MADVESERGQSLTDLVKAVDAWAHLKGWRDTPATVGDRLALMHSELSEALEEYRKGKFPNETYYDGDKPEGIPIELADVIIRIADFCGVYRIDLEEAVLIKLAYNQHRPYRHGGKLI